MIGPLLSESGGLYICVYNVSIGFCNRRRKGREKGTN